MAILDKKDHTKWCPQHGYPLPCAKCGLGEKEIGIQIGRKEVVAWVIEHYDNGLYMDEFKEQVKKWGIK